MWGAEGGLKPSKPLTVIQEGGLFYEWRGARWHGSLLAPANRVCEIFKSNKKVCVIFLDSPAGSGADVAA